MNSQDVENIAAARYIVNLKSGLNSVSGMNQNYGWGQGIVERLHQIGTKLKPEESRELNSFLKIFAGHGAEFCVDSVQCR